ncbi:MAG: glycosyltransferase [Nostoc sp.]|uniref:glycosyltransferase family 2 protein n=1 Tax=Nostoc sp. TaxID=1180 RepID=UPI002FEE8A8D
MSEQHPYRATIVPVSNETPRPLWSVMIPTYNCANYLRETLASVLAQDPGADVMQIEVIDDCSTKDDPKAVVEELGRGRVTFYRQPANIGYIRNFETCLQRSRGKLIHLLHGDDCIRDGFYRKMQRAFEQNLNIGAAFCRHIFMDQNSHWQFLSPLEQPKSDILSNWLEQIAMQQRIQTPSIVVRRNVYEQLGGFDRRFSCWCEDWEMWIRIAAHYPVWYEVEPLALYRKSSTSLTGESLRTGKNIQDFRKASEMVREYLPKQRANQITQKALNCYAFFALDCATELAAKGDTYGAINQMKEALMCKLSFKLILLILKLSIKLIYRNSLDKIRNFNLNYIS